MRAYGRRGRTAPTISISQSMASDVSFSQSEDEISNESEIEQTHSEMNTSYSSPGIKPKKTLNGKVEKSTDTTNRSGRDARKMIPSSDLILHEVDCHSSFETIEPCPSSDINISAHKFEISPKKAVQNDEKNMKDLQVFDFLDMPNNDTKRRKTNYYKHVAYDVEAQSEEEEEEEEEGVFDGPERINPSMNKVLENVGNFLLTLEPKKDHSLEDMFDEERKDCNKRDAYDGKVNKGQKVYNNRRTLLVKNSTIEDGEQSIVDEYLDEIEENRNKGTESNDSSVHITRSVIPKRNDKTYTFNELKNIGNSLKYQEDYDYLTNTLQKSTSLSSTISILSEFILAISGDDEFLLYIAKHHSDDICKWCLQQDPSNNQELLLLQGYILNLFHKSSDFFNKMENVKQVLLNLGKCVTVSVGLKTNSKMQKLMYLDFLKINGESSGLNYALNIWNTHITKFPTEYIAKVLRLLMKISDNQEKTKYMCCSSYFSLLQTVLDALKDNDLEGDDIDTEKREICKMLTNNNDLINNDEYLKCLVIATNDRSSTAIIDHKTVDDIMEVILHSIIRHLKGRSEGNDDNIILQLGVCLNTLNDCRTDINIPDTTWYRLKNLILQNDIHEVHTPIIQNLLYLNFAFLTIIKTNKNVSAGESLLSDTEKMQLTNALDLFKLDASNINKFVDEKIMHAIMEVKKI
ncbi:similar to Saccharomyces cerevisiae YDR014W RAD61 Subunit of a complex (Scc3p, Pds5p, Rad61p) that inhibits sister chromatid cohesion [Maudiozyma saulgeensis]|uniref:Similar to Saccharomyces cerevisiae YDR014W RAD61 Subunit of a complex (Scc3p, Pds5p, Rad61p) that inhibits sister chromatid cohesion n=1 Tax=Maudiozyma saulgeensis TaxID=1789683 RepID=A0A1X7R502_9SACH|nr:similar to Saccharomyces cerevisiae YDR014W RAD61 Subunit of a complex (Scc3p, Pds5p, Rad61p) that inhibits sister chromatid cohesion [Kazachstania saulgeensis]